MTLLGAPAPADADSVRPTVQITSPQPNATVSQDITLTMEASDDVGVVSVQVAVAGQIAAALSGAPYQVKLRLPPGRQRIDVRALDAAGNAGTASIVVVADAAGGGGGAPDPATPPRGPRSYGYDCQRASDCASHMCAEDPSYPGKKYCTERCSLGSACSLGGQCFRTSDPNLAVCGRPLMPPGSGGRPLEVGCSVAGRGDNGGAPRAPSTTALVVALALAVGLLLRRPGRLGRRRRAAVEHVLRR